jgi:hypothetical protein
VRSPIVYSVRQYQGAAETGSTAPLRGTLDAVVKRDGDAIRHCVYNEFAAAQLAQLLGMPAARGVLVAGREGLLFASLTVSTIGISLPDVGKRQVPRILIRYPIECAAMLAFDAWIGNWDRLDNLRANLDAKAPHQVFVAFDHSHCLLDAKGTVAESIAALASGEVIVERHPFAGRLTADAVSPWVDRIRQVDPMSIQRGCIFEHSIGSVAPGLQQELCDALIARQMVLDEILSRLVG